MQHELNKGKSWEIVYDARLIDKPGLEYFDVGFWRSRQALRGEAIGRGSAWFVDTSAGPAVLRHYLRGGWAAKLSRQSYFFSGTSRSRPFKEYHLLAQLYAQGLPVPRPVAALCRHRGVVSSGAIMTVRIDNAITLADMMNGEGGGGDVWTAVGACIRRFHDAGVWHADLNARNILLDSESRVFLIDFDRARFKAGESVNGDRNLSRLKRSLVKLCPAGGEPALQLAWAQLETGYAG